MWEADKNIEDYQIALEVLSELKEEYKTGLDSSHFSIKYSSERNIRNIDEIIELIEYKIEDMED